MAVEKALVVVAAVGMVSAAPVVAAERGETAVVVAVLERVATAAAPVVGMAASVGMAATAAMVAWRVVAHRVAEEMAVVRVAMAAVLEVVATGEAWVVDVVETVARVVRAAASGVRVARGARAVLGAMQGYGCLHKSSRCSSRPHICIRTIRRRCVRYCHPRWPLCQRAESCESPPLGSRFLTNRW